MALVINDRVKETTTTTGTGAVSLAGAVTGFETFAAGIGNSNTTYYVIAHQTAAEFEVGLGTLDGDSSDLTRTTVISSSNSDSAVDFAAGTKDVFCTMPASKLVFEDASSDVTLPNDLILGSDSAVLKFGADSDTTLTHTDGTGLTLNSTNKLLFRDSALYINSSTDGQLDIVADTEVQIAATTIDINGAVALNGAITGATNITLSGELDAATLDISGNADIDGTTNLDAVDIDGAVQLDATLTVGADDQGYDVKFFGDTASAYMLWDTSADDLVLAGAAGIDLAGDIDVDGTANLDNTDIDGTLAVDGTTISLDATTSLNIDNSNTSNGITIGTATSGVPISIGHTTSEVTINDNLTVTGTLTLGSGAELAEAELEMLDGITAGTVAASKAVVVDSNKDAASFRNVTLTGELDAATLDISGNADIDGTTNLDAVDIDGAVQLDATFTVGADDQGYDVKLFGDTASAYMLWDTSADDLILGGAAGLIVPEGKLTLGSTAVTSTAAELNLLDGVSGLVQADLTKLAAVDSTAAELNIVDGGTSATSTTLADADRLVTNDNGTMVQVALSDVKTYLTSAGFSSEDPTALAIALG
jgi:cytoskeletal protein CcmA (bactofilin family)